MKIAQLSYPFCITDDGRVWEWHSCGLGCEAGWYMADASGRFFHCTVAEREAAILSEKRP